MKFSGLTVLLDYNFWSFISIKPPLLALYFNFFLNNFKSVHYL